MKFDQKENRKMNWENGFYHGVGVIKIIIWYMIISMMINSLKIDFDLNFYLLNNNTKMIQIAILLILLWINGLLK